MDYNPDGSLLASIGGNPDYMLTVWDWRRESIVLRSKAFSQDIYRVSFSPELPGQLTTSGTGHIRFWKMATTFTGLKLQGYLGKFGRTELSDISGIAWRNFKRDNNNILMNLTILSIIQQNLPFSCTCPLIDFVKLKFA